MLKDIDIPSSGTYTSDTDFEPIEAYFNCLIESNRFDLLLGYFSSNAIRLLSYGFATFLSNGGTLRMMINHHLTKSDYDAIVKGSKGNETEFNFSLNNISEIKESLSRNDQHFFNCLAWLISKQKIQIKIGKPDDNGILHFKETIFSDGDSTVCLSGSANFTRRGLVGNREEVNIYASWENESIKNRIEHKISNFEKYFFGKVDSIDIIDINQKEAIAFIKGIAEKKELPELISEEKELINCVIKSNERIKRLIDEATEKIERFESTPRFPYDEGPREYQKEAFENWKINNQQGLFAMATGTGKTITALNCLLEVYKKTGYYKAIILVPTITLVNQWEQECKEFNFSSIIKVYSKNRWQDDFGTILTRERLSPTEEVSFIVITTYASYARKHIFYELNQLPAKTLFIADECHNMGSGSFLKLLSKVKCKRRIGLSATPERQFDEDGTNSIYSFFNCTSGYTYEFSMELAIKGDIDRKIDPVLCSYYYYPHLVPLTDSEMRDYMKLSLEISKFYNSDSDSFRRDSILTAKLLARKRIIHKAINKVSIFRSILKDQYKKKRNLKYSLVYVPEGNDTNDYFETDLASEKEEIADDIDTVHLIDVFTKVVKDIDKRVTTKKFISGTHDKEKTLEQFARGEIDVLTSMKCLDEGVDVPRSELAIFCASTGNPRQFIQRRGRILRKHKKKPFAYIHDLVVIPEINSNDKSYNMERSMLKKELERVKNFSILSENSSHTIDVLIDIMNHYNLNLYKNE